ncbi:MAG: hypothetical protein KGJ78_17520 [Alphaproteobacteria bacterium]|nr:hypothetical protein [Alphaproteobacteria bacterium]
MKAALLLAGLVGLLLGLLFAGQGLGYLPWPKASFMIGQIIWAYYGTGIALIGLALIVLSRR